MSGKGPEGADANPHKKMDSVWRGESGLFGLMRLERARQFAPRALAGVVNTVMAPYNKEGTRTAEVGAGMGYLRQLVQEWKGDWIQLEPSETLTGQAKKRAEKGGREDAFVVGSAYELPFPENSMDNVVGLASYDVFHRLDAATAETARVLKPGGHFVHFLDFRAPADPLMHMFDDAGVPYEYVPARNDQEPSTLRVKVTDPAFASVLEQLVLEEGITKGMREVDMNATFEKLLVLSLERQGLEIVSAGKQVEKVRGPRVGLQNEFPNIVNFLFKEGEVVATVGDEKPLPGLPKNNTVGEEAQIDVVIARKRETAAG